MKEMGQKRVSNIATKWRERTYITADVATEQGNGKGVRCGGLVSVVDPVFNH